MNNSGASRRLRCGASSTGRHFRLFTHGRQEEPYHCATHHEGYRRAEVHYRKAKTHCQCVGERGPITHASDTCARSIELNITASRPVRSACSRARANIWRVGGRAEAAQEHQQQQNEIVAVPQQHAGENAQQTANNQAFAIAFSVGTPGQNWLTRCQ